MDKSQIVVLIIGSIISVVCYKKKGLVTAISIFIFTLMLCIAIWVVSINH
jgi:predicted membrane channel-forming protein YqfA (hemolysin III family)